MIRDWITTKSIESFLGISLKTLRWLTSPYCLLFLVALIVHGLLLLNDGVYWDGWLIYTWLSDRNWASLYTWASESGDPSAAYFHWGLGQLRDTVFSYKMATFVFINLSTCLTYKICKESGLLSGFDCLAVALLWLIYPSYQVHVELIMLPYVLYYCVFLLGVWLALRAEQSAGKRHVTLRMSALASIFTAFTVNSLLTFYFGILLFLFLYKKKVSGLSWVTLFTRLLPRRLDYVLLPFVYWCVIRIWFPVHGHYSESGYNHVSFSILSLINAMVLFIKNGIYTQINEALLMLAGQPVVILFVIGVALWVYRVCRMSEVRTPGSANAYAVLAFGMALLFTGIFPYAAVGKWPTAHGWESRHSLLMALPLALIIVAGLRLAFTTTGGTLGKTGWTVLLLLLVSFSLATINTYVGWQARWVKDRSIMVKLADLPQAKACSVFWVDDRFPLGGEESHRFYEWAYMFRYVWGDERRIGIDYRSGPERLASMTKKGNLFNSRWALGQFDPNGPQARMTIRCAYGRTAAPYRLCALYQFYRFIRPVGMKDFLKSVVEVDVEPLASPWVKGTE